MLPRSEGYIARSAPRINIKGYVIASPAVDTVQLVNTIVLYAYHMSLIPKELYQVIFVKNNWLDAFSDSILFYIQYNYIYKQ